MDAQTILAFQQDLLTLQKRIQYTVRYRTQLHEKLLNTLYILSDNPQDQHALTMLPIHLEREKELLATINTILQQQTPFWQTMTTYLNAHTDDLTDTYARTKNMMRWRAKRIVQTCATIARQCEQVTKLYLENEQHILARIQEQEKIIQWLATTNRVAGDKKKEIRRFVAILAKENAIFDAVMRTIVPITRNQRLLKQIADDPVFQGFHGMQKIGAVVTGLSAGMAIAGENTISLALFAGVLTAACAVWSTILQEHANLRNIQDRRIRLLLKT